MPHVELSLSDDSLAQDPSRAATTALGAAPTPAPSGRVTLQHWAELVSAADEACLVLDADGMIVACSPAFRALLGRPEEAEHDQEWVGRGLLEALFLVDLTGAAEPLAPWEAERIPPLLALSTGKLARGVIRVRLGDSVRTVDAVSTPLGGVGDGQGVSGSLTFLRPLF